MQVNLKKCLQTEDGVSWVAVWSIVLVLLGRAGGVLWVTVALWELLGLCSGCVAVYNVCHDTVRICVCAACFPVLLVH